MSKTLLNLGKLSASIAVLASTACSATRQHAGQPPNVDRRVINPPGLSPLVPVYSIAVRMADMVYVSGMTGVVPGTQDIIAGGVAAQTRQTLENIRTALLAGGARMSDVGECTVFLRDINDFPAMNTVFKEFFPTEPPARATIAVSAFPRPAALVEIKCSAWARR